MLRAINDHRSLSEGFDRNHIHGTGVPMEEPFTASEADMRRRQRDTSAGFHAVLLDHRCSGW